MADFPVALRVGEAPVADELDLDKGFSSLTGKKLRDRDKFILDALQDGAAAPFDLNVNNTTVQGTAVTNGTLTSNGAATFNGTATFNGEVTFGAAADFAERALIFAGL